MSEAGQNGDLMWSSLLHAGLAGSFLRLPVAAPQREALSARKAQAAFYGIPWDSTSISRTGANYGPRGMREVSCQFLGYNAALDFDVVERLAPVDCGDARVVLANAEKTFAAAQRDIGEILAAGALPVVLGGDHSVTIPAVRAVRERYERPGLVLIDSHLDTAIDVGGETLNHCCPISRAVEAGFAPEHIVLVGMNGWLNPPAELAYAREHGIEVIWLEELWAEGTERAVERALAIAGHGTDGVYLSFDIDSLDAAYAVGTCVPTPGGLTAREAIELVRGIGAGGLVGLDVVEVAPSLDPTSMTAALGCRIALEALAFHAGARVPEHATTATTTPNS
ncbi:MAG TPA: agmatinase [Conexibacter sp.]|jgi:guanidinobutyrase|nr:agmatinase [Conexibacter sp.]